MAYARSLEVWGKSGKFDIIVPNSHLSGTALFEGESKERTISGLNDPRFRFSVLFYGAPVLSVKEFGGWQQDLIVGASVQVSAPAGQYDPNKLVNLGTNRWFVKPDIGISKAWGDLTLEISAGLIFFSRNNEYFGGKTLEQDPVSTSQIHLMYNFRPGLWAALSGTYDYGGRTTVNGKEGTTERAIRGWEPHWACPSTGTTRSSFTRAPVSPHVPEAITTCTGSAGSTAGATVYNARREFLDVPFLAHRHRNRAGRTDRDDSSQVRCGGEESAKELCRAC